MSPAALRAAEAPEDAPASTAVTNIVPSALPPAVSPESLHVLEQDNGWPAGSISTQLNRDPTLVPFGKGALFVPAMVNPLDEPPVTVWRGNDKVAEALSGVRIPVPPGEYSVQIGSGSVQQRFSTHVEVKELATTVVPVTWAGLSVHVMDAKLNSLRGPYEVIRMDDREYIGIGFGTDEQAGEPVSTWILKPGLYKLVRVGSSYHARTDFATVRLLEGQHTHFILVQDATGAFQGAGEARPEELFRPGEGLWASLIFGGDVSFNSRKSVIGSPDGNGYTFHVFLDTKANAEIFNSPMLLRLQVEEGQSRLPRLPWQKIQDRAQIDGLYIYALRPWAGPYVRARGTTNLFPGTQFFDPVSEISIHDKETGTTQSLSGVKNLTLSPPLGSITIKEGMGFNLRVFKNIFAETTIRTGFGAQHLINRNVLQDVTKVGDPIHKYDKVPTDHQVGMELTVIAVARLTRWVVANVVVDALFPFGSFKQPDLDVEASLAVKLTQFVALNYVLRYQQVPRVYTNAIREQDILLRFSLELF